MNLFHWDTAQTLFVILSFLIPGVSQLIARQKWPEGVVGVITLTVTALGAFFTQWAAAGNLNHYDWKNAAGVALFAYIIAVGAHFQLWKGTSAERNLRKI